MAFSQSWVETEPDGAVVTVSQLDDWIRNTKIAIRERLEGDAADNGLIESGTWATGPKPKLGSARIYYTTAGGLGALPLENGRLAVTDAGNLYHLKSTGAVLLNPPPGGAGAYLPLTGGNVTGSVGIGGSVPSNVRFYVESNLAEKAAYIRQVNTSGVGLRIQTINGSTYSLKVSGAAAAGVDGPDMFQVLGKGAILLGLASGSAYTKSVASGETGLYIIAGQTGTGGTAQIWLTSASPAVSHGWYANGGDRSQRRLFNFNPDFTTSDATLGQMREDWEQNGVIYWGIIKPANAVAGAWDGGDRKAFGMSLGGATTPQMGEYVQLFSCIPGRGIQLGAVDSGGSQNVVTRWAIQIKGNGAPANPVSIIVGGLLKNVQIDGSGFLKGV